jgi:hypothetical protein
LGDAECHDVPDAGERSFMEYGAADTDGLVARNHGSPLRKQGVALRLHAAPRLRVGLPLNVTPSFSE